MKISTTTRSKFILPLAVMAFVAMFALAGCSGGSNAEVIEKLDKMQMQMDEMDSRIDELAGDTTSDDAAATDTATESAKTDATNDAAAFKTQLQDFEKRMNAAIKEAESAAVPSNAADRPSAYREAKAPLNKLDNELDAFDDSLEAAYNKGSITQDEFWELEKMKEQYEDKLDNAEDALENRMGVDD